MNYQKIVQAVAYLAGKCGVGGLNRLHAYKLLYLADRDSLRKSGITITGDCYNAMQYGPLPVYAERILKGEAKEEAKYSSKYLTVVPLETKNAANLVAIGNDQFEQLSEADKESLDVAVEVYRKHPDIIAYTHRFPEWRRARNSGRSKCRMKFEDFFLSPSKGVEYCSADPEWVKTAKAAYEETAWVAAL